MSDTSHDVSRGTLIVQQRNAVVTEAFSWVGTRFRWRAAVKDPSGKGGGTDCAGFLASSYRDAGVFDDGDLKFYSPQSHLNQTEEIYLKHIQKNADELLAKNMYELPECQPGDIVICKLGKIFWHGAIITSWPHVIHCVKDTGVIEVDATLDPNWIGHERKFFSPKVWR